LFWLTQDQKGLSKACNGADVKVWSFRLRDFFQPLEMWYSQGIPFSFFINSFSNASKSPVYSPSWIAWKPDFLRTLFHSFFFALKGFPLMQSHGLGGTFSGTS